MESYQLPCEVHAECLDKLKRQLREKEELAWKQLVFTHQLLTQLTTNLPIFQSMILASERLLLLDAQMDMKKLISDREATQEMIKELEKHEQAQKDHFFVDSSDENSPVDNPPADNPPVDNPPADDPPVDNSPDENPDA